MPTKQSLKEPFRSPGLLLLSFLVVLLTACSALSSPVAPPTAAIGAASAPAVASPQASPTALSSPTPESPANVSAILTVTAQKLPAGIGAKTPSSAAPATVHALIAAHRGGAAYAPENTLAAFDRSIQHGFDMVECDVHLSRDGALVVMHDPNVATTTDGRGLISDLTLGELKKLNDAAKFPGGYAAQTIPTLPEVLDLVKGKIGIQIEIKNTATGGRYAGIEKKVIDLIAERGMLDQVIIISFDFGILKDVKTIEPRIRTGALVQANWFVGRSADQSVSDAIAQTGAEYFLPTYSPVTQAVVDAAHARGIKLGVWTVDASADMQRFAGFGVDAITTNRPDDLMKVLGR